jgi:cell division GTPase FtsZ
MIILSKINFIDVHLINFQVLISLDTVLKDMGAQVNAQSSQYIVYDARGMSEPDTVYEAAIKIADEIMDGIDRLTFTNTIEAATLFITGTGAQLIILARSFDESIIAPAFRSTLKSVSYEPETGYIQRYVIPILDVESSS